LLRIDRNSRPEGLKENESGAVQERGEERDRHSIELRHQGRKNEEGEGAKLTSIYISYVEPAR
jgi:hypothetical protein